MKINVNKNSKCPLRHSCFDFIERQCAECEIGKEIVKLHRRIERLKNKLEKTEQILNTESAKELIPYGEYPKGLFIKDNTLCLKTEYFDKAYIVWSGERFAGGVTSTAERFKLPILPIDDELVQMIEKKYGKKYKELTELANG